MVALRDPPHLGLRERIDRAVLVHFDTGLRERVAERRIHQRAAEPVVHHSHPHAGERTRDQRVAVLAPDGVVREQIGDQMDVMAGARDRGELRSVGRGSVDEQRHLVAGDERALCDRALDLVHAAHEALLLFGSRGAAQRCVFA